MGALLTILVGAAIWFILIPGLKEASGALHSAVPTCQDVARQKPEAERAEFIRRCESQQSAAYVTSFMSM